MYEPGYSLAAYILAVYIWHFKDHNSQMRYENWTNTPFFHLLSEPYLFVIFILFLENTQNSFSRGPPLISSCLQNKPISDKSY